MQPFSNPWKQKNSTVFWCFQGVEKKCIGNKWVSSWKIVLIYFCYIIWSRQKVFKSCKFSLNTVRWLEVLCTFNSRHMSRGFDLIAFVCNVKRLAIVFLFVSFSFLVLFLDGLANFFSSVFIRYPGYVSPWSNLIHDRPCLFTPCALKIMVDLNEHGSLALETVKSLNLHFHNTYGHQTWLGDDLHSRAPTHKVTWPFT